MPLAIFSHIEQDMVESVDKILGMILVEVDIYKGLNACLLID